ncbi:MAG: hypothetical protein KDA81_17990, partial [Planctomycetaceae bacterium]|nr:hypothetical protein [Planctomycetaceae bacterium]
SDLLTEVDINGDGRFSKGTGLSGDIFIDINNPDGDSKNRLTFAELTSTPVKELFNAGISTEAYVDLALSADTDFAGLPELTADLTVDWAIGLTVRDGLVGGGLPDVSIRDVTLDVGSMFETTLVPVIQKFNDNIGAIKPLVKFLASPVPGLNDLSELVSGPKITFLTLGILGTGVNESSIKAAKIANQVVGVLNEVFEFGDAIEAMSADADGVKINFGTYHLSGGGKDLTDPNADLAIDPAMLDTTLIPGTDGGLSPGVLDQTANSGTAGSDKTKSALSKLTGSADSNGKGGLGIKIPLLSDPSNIFKLFTGEKADIIQWDIPTLDLKVPFKMELGPIPFEPSPLYVTFGAALEAFVDLSVGFDTRGIAKTGNFIDGLYFGDLEDVTSGPDIDEFMLSLEATVGAAIKKGPFSAGIEGGLRADIGLNWNDLDGDGKLYLDEIADLFELRPEGGGGFPGVCVFDAHGEFTAFLRAYLKIPFKTFNIDIADIELYSFNHHCAAPGVAELGTKDSELPEGTLLLFAGEHADDRGPLYGDDINEEFSVRQFLDTDVESETFDQEVTEVTFHFTNRDDQPDTVVRTYTGVKNIIFTGGDGNDKITIDASVTVPTRLIGGAGNDILIGGSGADIISGGLGNDRMEGGAGNDHYVFSDSWGQDIVVEIKGGPDTQDTFDFGSVTQSLNVAYGSIAVTSGSNRVDGGPNQAGVTVRTEGIERFIAGGGNDSLTVGQIIGAHSENTWNLTGQGQGDINNEFSFAGFENLRGGAQNDIFKIDQQDGVAGAIDGAGGRDTLDYSTLTETVRVDMQTGTANNIGRFVGINEFIGGLSNSDSLLGPNQDINWTLDGQDSGTVDSSGFRSFENLTGGDKNDRFEINANGRLTGKLIGTRTVGQTDNDRIDASGVNVDLRFAVTGRNQGTVAQNLPLVNFASIENLTGGSANDTFAMSPGSSISGQTDGSAGLRDHLDYSAWTTAVSVTLDGSNQVGTVTGVEDVTGSSAADTITGNALGNRLIGGGGADTLHGKGGNNLIIGDLATIEIVDGAIASIRTNTTFSANDTITFGDGNNILLPGSGSDSVTFEADNGGGRNFIGGDQVLVTLSGGRVVTMQSIQPSDGGADTITVGAGDDFIIAGNGADTITDTGGRNVIIGDRGTIQLVNELPTFAISQISVGSGNDNITTGGNIDAIIAGGGDDVVKAGDGDNYVLGDNGSITFVTGVPVSSVLNLSASDGNDDITTGAGRDFVFTGNGDNTVHAGDDNDDVVGGSGIDIIHGEGGDDFLVGMLGDDTIDGGSGNDVMFGGLPYGLRTDYQLGTDDFTSPPSENANPFFPGFDPTQAFLITPKIVGGDSIDGITGDGRDVLHGRDGNDVIFGGADSDELYGGSGVDYLDAGAGNDLTILGEDGDDVIRGGFGNDELHGGSGIDQVYGDAGDDTLYGEAGDSTGKQAGQRLFGGDGRDVLFAFAPTTDFATEKLLVGDQLFGGPGGDFLHGNLRKEVFDGGGGNDFISGDEFAGFEYAARTDADVNGADDVLVGGSGEDQLFGGGGDDEIWGGAGTDYIVGQQGSDRQYGGSGIDLFVLPTSLGIDGHRDPGTDTIDGHFGNDPGEPADRRTVDDNATDILTIDGTTGNDTILIGKDTASGQAGVFYNSGAPIRVNMLDANGNLLIEQFRIAGLAGNDTIGFHTELALTSGALASTPTGLEPLDLSAL